MKQVRKLKLSQLSKNELEKKELKKTQRRWMLHLRRWRRLS